MMVLPSGTLPRLSVEKIHLTFSFRIEIFHILMRYYVTGINKLQIIDCEY